MKQEAVPLKRAIARILASSNFELVGEDEKSCLLSLTPPPGLSSISTVEMYVALDEWGRSEVLLISFLIETKAPRDIVDLAIACNEWNGSGHLLYASASKEGKLFLRFHAVQSSFTVSQIYNHLVAIGISDLVDFLLWFDTKGLGSQPREPNLTA